MTTPADRERALRDATTEKSPLAHVFCCRTLSAVLPRSSSPTALSETFIDASFGSAKKGALVSADSPRKRQ